MKGVQVLDFEWVDPQFLPGTSHGVHILLTNNTGADITIAVALTSKPGAGGWTSHYGVSWGSTTIPSGEARLFHGVARMKDSEGADGGQLVTVVEANTGQQWRFDFPPIVLKAGGGPAPGEVVFPATADGTPKFLQDLADYLVGKGVMGDVRLVGWRNCPGCGAIVDVRALPAHTEVPTWPYGITYHGGPQPIFQTGLHVVGAGYIPEQTAQLYKAQYGHPGLPSFGPWLNRRCYRIGTGPTGFPMYVQIEQVTSGMEFGLNYHTGWYHQFLACAPWSGSGLWDASRGGADYYCPDLAIYPVEGSMNAGQKRLAEDPWAWYSLILPLALWVFEWSGSGEPPVLGYAEGMILHAIPGLGGEAAKNGRCSVEIIADEGWVSYYSGQKIEGRAEITKVELLPSAFIDSWYGYECEGVLAKLRVTLEWAGPEHWVDGPYPMKAMVAYSDTYGGMYPQKICGEVRGGGGGLIASNIHLVPGTNVFDIDNQYTSCILSLKNVQWPTGSPNPSPPLFTEIRAAGLQIIIDGIAPWSGRIVSPVFTMEDLGI